VRELRAIAVGISVIAIVAGAILSALYPHPSPPPRPDPAAQAAAVAQFPDLAKPGSRLNIEFVRRHNLYRKTAPALFADPNWPTKLASECSRDLATGTMH